VGCGAVVRRAQAQLVKAAIKNAAREMCEPVQLGQGTSAGTQCMGMKLGSHMELFPDQVIFKDDANNAFNSVQRAAIMAEISKPGSKLLASTRYFESELRPVSNIYGLKGGQLAKLDFHSVNGGKQGALSAGIGHNAAVQPDYERIDTAIGVHGGTSCAICDDFLVAGPAEVLWPILAEHLEARRLRTGLTSNMSKAQVFSPNGIYGDLPEGVTVGTMGRARNAAGEWVGEMGMGIIAGGVPIGDDVFRRNFVAQKVDEVSGEIEKNHTLLRSVNAHDHAFHVIRLSDAHRLDYLTQVVPPQIPGIRDEYQRFDELLHRLRSAALGVDYQNLNPATHSNTQLILQRTNLAKRHRGMGFVQVNDVCLASFAGCVNMTIPRFPNGVRPDGTVIRGLAAHLEPAVGSAEDFSSPQGRYQTFLGSGLSQAEGFRTSWDTMRAEVGPGPEGVFSAAAEDAPGVPRPEDVREADSDRLRLQRLCTCERQRTRLRHVSQEMGRLDFDDPVRMGWECSNTGELWATLPRLETRCSATVFSMAFCIYMGISNPGIETEINGGMTEYPDKINRSGRPTIRTLDPYGQSLSLYGAKGNFRLGMHNAVERELTEVARTCGLDPVRQDPIVFGGAIPVGPARDSYARAVRTARKTGNRNRGGLVPDVTIRNFPTIDGGLPQTRIYEVKTFGHKENQYGV
jgi:hypothetical protein